MFVLVAIVGALAVNQIFFPQTATVRGGPLNVVAYLDETQWFNTTTVDWGLINQGMNYSKTFKVVNIGNDTVTISLNVTDLAADLTENWDTNTPTGLLNIGDTATGLLWLNVSKTAMPRPYSWNMTLSVTAAA